MYLDFHEVYVMMGHFLLIWDVSHLQFDFRDTQKNFFELWSMEKNMQYVLTIKLLKTKLNWYV